MKGKAQSEVINTVVCPIIRNDFVIPMLESLKVNTPSNFRSIVINQCQPNREFEEKLYDNCDYIIRPHYNLGFAMASNLGIRLAPTKYVTVVNDDVLFTSPGWWQGIEETFKKFPMAAAVNCQSPKEPGWGWAEPGYRYLIPERYMTGDLKQLHDRDRELMAKVKEVKAAWEEFQGRGVRDADTGKQLLARLEGRKRKYQETQDALEERILKLSYDKGYISALTEEKNWAVVDAFACWCTVCKTDALAKIGLFDERFRDGGGEDYDFMSRAYQAGYRCLSTSKAWCYHHWGRSKDSPDGFNTALPSIGPHWNCLSTKGFGEQGLWDPDLDCWGRTGVRTDPKIFRHHL